MCYGTGDTALARSGEGIESGWTFALAWSWEEGRKPCYSLKVGCKHRQAHVMSRIPPPPPHPPTPPPAPRPPPRANPSHVTDAPKQHAEQFFLIPVLPVKSPRRWQARAVSTQIHTYHRVSVADVSVLISVIIVEARKLEHQYPHVLKLEYRGS